MIPEIPQPGFDHWEAFKGQGEYYNPRLNTNGKWIQYADSVYVTDLLTHHAIDFIDQQTKNHQPFMVYLSHKGVHDNFQPAKRHKGCYRDKPLVYPASFNTPKYGITTPPTIDSLTGKAASGKDFYGENMMPNWVKNQRESWHGVDYSYHGRPWETQVRNYCETLRSVDESIGAVLDYLVEKGLDKNTIVIYMGDNGFAWGEHGLIDKRQFYEESVRVPMLVWAPGLFPGGEVVEKMVQNVDIAPTLMHCAGLKKAPQWWENRSYHFCSGKISLGETRFLRILLGIRISTNTNHARRPNGSLQIHSVSRYLGYKRILRSEKRS